MQTNENGRSMIEMLGVLAIIGILSVGGIAGYSKAMAKYRTNKVIEQVSMIVTNIRTLYAQQNTYEGLNTNTAVEMGAVPEELIADGSITGGQATNLVLKNGFKGNVVIGEASSRTGEDGTAGASYTAFEVEFDGLSRDACVAIATSDWGAGASAGFIGIKVAGQPNTSAIAADDPRPTDVTDLVVGCAGQSAANGVALACPGGNTQSIPLKVTEASAACNCVGANANKCSLTWKYY